MILVPCACDSRSKGSVRKFDFGDDLHICHMSVSLEGALQDAMVGTHRNPQNQLARRERSTQGCICSCWQLLSCIRRELWRLTWQTSKQKMKVEMIFS